MKIKKVDEAGEEFLEELFHHHFGCERSQPSTISCMASEVPTQVSAPASGADEFISRLFKYFHHDTTFVDEVPASGYEQTENAA